MIETFGIVWRVMFKMMTQPLLQFEANFLKVYSSQKVRFKFKKQKDDSRALENH